MYYVDGPLLQHYQVYDLLKHYQRSTNVEKIIKYSVIAAESAFDSNYFETATGLYINVLQYVTDKDLDSIIFESLVSNLSNENTEHAKKLIKNASAGEAKSIMLSDLMGKPLQSMKSVGSFKNGSFSGIDNLVTSFSSKEFTFDHGVTRVLKRGKVIRNIQINATPQFYVKRTLQQWLSSENIIHKCETVVTSVSDLSVGKHIGNLALLYFR